MQNATICFLALSILWLIAQTTPSQAAPVTLWPVDPLVKVFPDTPAPSQPDAPVRLQCARNEIESAQLALRSDRDLENVTVRVSPLRHTAGAAFLSEEQFRWNLVGYVPVKKNSPETPPSERLREAPFAAPDPLLEDRTFALKAGETRPIWLTLNVPEQATPGEYRGTVTVETPQGRASLPVEVAVYPFALPAARHLYVTNWFSLDAIARAHQLSLWSEEFWKVLERYARSMAEHRQNVVLTPLSAITLYREEDGSLSFDYSRLDRFIQLFDRFGVADRIELSHPGGFGEGGWESPVIRLHSLAATDRRTGQSLSLEAKEALPPFLKALEGHLAEKGWLDRVCIHVADEPAEHNRASWMEASELIHRAAPRLKRIDAIETTGFGETLEIWVPKLNHLRNWMKEYEAARHRGAELWFYTCCHPFGYYPNRFIDYPLIKTRILHWLNWRFQLAGYLHWGLNFWTANPFEDLNDASLPPGDSFIIYPGKSGPLSSIRWEAMRDGLEDYEYLWLLSDTFAALARKLQVSDLPASARSDEICRRLVRSITEYEHDPARLYELRHLIAREIIQLTTPPTLLVVTSPPCDAELIPGPISIIVRGAADPGATVTVNGQPVPLDPKGAFSAQTWPDQGKVTVIAEKEGQRKTVIREFQVKG